MRRSIDKHGMITMLTVLCPTYAQLHPDWTLVRTEIDVNLWAHLDDNIVAQLCKPH